MCELREKGERQENINCLVCVTSFGNGKETSAEKMRVGLADAKGYGGGQIGPGEVDICLTTSGDCAWE